MSIKNATAPILGTLLALCALTTQAQETKTDEAKPGRSCCMSACAQHASGTQATDDHASGKPAGEPQAPGKMRCSLTGQTMESCCCVHTEGRLHCQLADKDVESCCCKPVSDETDATDTTDNAAGKDRP